MISLRFWDVMPALLWENRVEVLVVIAFVCGMQYGLDSVPRQTAAGAGCPCEARP